MKRIIKKSIACLIVLCTILISIGILSNVQTYNISFIGAAILCIVCISIILFGGIIALAVWSDDEQR